MRLTDHLEKDSVFTLDEITAGKCYKKLSQLEDIEDELGIDLVTLLKAVKNGAWYIHNDGHKYYCFEKNPYLTINWDKWCICFDYEHCYPIENYLDKENGWALTKEELE